ncbi:P-type conjugative transfer protein VirB9 [Wolbachia pipientis]|uniref:P-type conjugative transfer protein VirB9 n=1 Tax=Wolbachia pipientis TaxID=955 RepID=A0A1E7QK23_WOLPI|nr:P-type conjugative transfer protein VirB9 [Wolbachia pipientis]OEY86822.1 P-type conjugative transfer protein VirB9 [Wolbachia pipientis]
MVRILLTLVLLFSGFNVSSYNKPLSVDSRIKTFVYSPNEVFQVVFSQGYYSYIEFSSVERIMDIAIGNASNWRVHNSGNKLFIMPFESSSRTNMIVTTTKNRTYVFDLISRPNYDKQSDDITHDYSAVRDISYIVRFYYPAAEDEFDLDIDVNEHTQIEFLSEKPETIIKDNDTKYNYTYVNYSSNENIVPVELFDDGCLTYLKFKDNATIPEIFAADGKPCKRLLFESYVIIKGVHRKLFIRDKNDRVEVINRAL